MPYYRQVGKLPPSSMVMFTPADAVHAAGVMNERDSDHVYVEQARFMGYEGPDRGVTMRSKTEYHGLERLFIRWLTREEMLELCVDRPFVSQADAWSH
jgi:hypothetical protein